MNQINITYWIWIMLNIIRQDSPYFYFIALTATLCFSGSIITLCLMNKLLSTNPYWN